MRIAITVDPYIPVPPQLYGGIERIVDFLVRGLVRRGHKVTLLAHPDSRVECELVPYGVPPHHGPGPRARELWQVASVLWRRRKEFDVVHSFGRLAALLPVLPYRGLAKVQSYQRDVVPWDSVATAVRLAGRSIVFTGCSGSVYREWKDRDGRAGEWLTIHNGVDLSKYRFAPSVAPQAPLVFLGRVERIKGAHHAIAVARATGRRLVIAGNRVDDAAGREYFETEIAPHVDGDRIRYVGPVNDTQKNELLGTSAAFLMPIEWEEPFGIVMAEALACGTPVIGFARGSVPEVVRSGVTGFVCGAFEDMVHAVHGVAGLDRAAARADCEARFSDDVIVARYEQLYAARVAMQSKRSAVSRLGRRAGAEAR